MAESKKEIRLPIGFYEETENKFYRGFEISGLAADILSKIKKDSANKFRVFGQLVAAGLTKLYDIETGEELKDWRKRASKLFFQDTLFLMVEILVKTTGTTKMSTVYKCPYCNKFTKFENDPDGSEDDDSGGFALDQTDDELDIFDKEDLRNLNFNEFNSDRPEFDFKSKGVNFDGIKYKKYRFSLPRIEDYINESGKGAAEDIERRVLNKNLIEIDGVTEKDLTRLKMRAGLQLMKFPLKEFGKLITTYDRIGYDFNNHKTTCGDCNYEYKTKFDLTNFFGGALGGTITIEYDDQGNIKYPFVSWMTDSWAAALSLWDIEYKYLILENIQFYEVWPGAFSHKELMSMSLLERYEYQELMEEVVRKRNSKGAQGDSEVD